MICSGVYHYPVFTAGTKKEMLEVESKFISGEIDLMNSGRHSCSVY